MFQKIKYWFIREFLFLANVQAGNFQYKPCVYCGKKYWFDIVKCSCGLEECKNEAICVCNNCTDKIQH